MTNDNNESKLPNRLEVKFTNYSIDTFVPSFEFKDEGGTFTKDQLTVPLVEVGPTLKRGAFCCQVS